MKALLTRPSVLQAIDAPKPWGWELWLTATRPEGSARLPHADTTLTELVDTHPEVLGVWSRHLFGDEMPIFAKLIHTDFPTRVHIGFRRPVERGQFLSWLEQEQALMRGLFAALHLPNGAAFAAYQTRYSAWATEQALSGWRRDDDAAVVAELAPFVSKSLELAGWLRAVRANRAAIVDCLNDVNLKDETGNLLLSSAGIVHAIFGLSHQTHPLDRSRAALEALFETLAARVTAGASDDELAETIEAAGLPDLRAENHAPPKNEAWLPTFTLGADVLAEPQQTSDTTYSVADFYTPFTWSGERAQFRKGKPAEGLAREDLAKYLADVDFSATSVASIRRSPERVAGSAREGAELSCLVDEPSRWPFFTAYQIDMTGTAELRAPPGVSQQIVVTRGHVELGDGEGLVGEVSPRSPGFVPATLRGGYTLTARNGEPATVMLYSPPGARGGSPTLIRTSAAGPAE